ncbi:MAG: MATE family efflux transporter [Oscillospiraceae bacterium]|nr:MATE family efflux transporter [Oscillospiraceae bacterium]
MSIKLSDHFSIRRLLRFTLPSIFMMVFTSLYGMVDGFFVSNFVGKTPFAAVNFIMPLLMMLATVGFMLGMGGSALIAKTLGEGDNKKANEIFSFFVYISIVAGVVIAALGFIFMPQIASWLGAEGQLLSNSITYGRIVIAALPAYIVHLEFESFFSTAEKPKFGLRLTVICGVLNIVLDALFIAGFHWGIVGAALATAVSHLVSGVVPIVYFARPNTGLLRLQRAPADWKALGKACFNGVSELINNIAMSLVGMLYNAQLLLYAGENGVAAYGVLMYVSFAFNAAFIGYSIGMSPVVGYHYGAQNHPELKGLLKKSIIIIGVCSVCMFALAEVLGAPLSKIFVGYDPELYALTSRAFTIYSFSFIFSGFAIFSSGFFTALNDGVTSAIISFLRTLVFEVLAVMLLPLIWGVDGIWISVVFAELMAVTAGVIFLIAKRKRFHYM